MQILGAIITTCSNYYRDITHDGIIEVSSTCELTPAEILCFDKALYLVEKALKDEGNYSRDHHANVFFVNNDAVTFLYTNPHTMGVHQGIVLYFVHRWRANQLSEQEVLVAMLEELCHCLWHIHDELIIKEKVAAIARPLIPNASVETLYHGSFVLPDGPL